MSNNELTITSALINKPKITPVQLVSIHLFAHLNWLYCELTGEDTAPALRSTSRVCRLETLFTSFFNYVDSSYYNHKDMYRSTAVLLESVFNVFIRHSKIEENMKKIGFTFMYFKLKDTHRLIEREYKKCSCYKKLNKSAEEKHKIDYKEQVEEKKD